MGRSKLQNACRTCKIRKVKCDGGRPACSRCTTTGRCCDGYGIWGGGNAATYYTSVVNRPASSRRPRSLPPLKLDQDEQCYFDWFRSRASIKVAGLFKTPFWDSLVLQAMHSEPAVLHAALAFSAAHRVLPVLTEQGVARDQEYSASKECFTLRQYCKAIAHLQPHFAKGTRNSTRIALIVCYLFSCIEFLRGHYKTGNKHLRHGSRLLCDLDHSTEGTPDTIEVWLAQAFARMITYPTNHPEDARHLHLLLMKSTHRWKHSRDGFESLAHARRALDEIFWEMFLEDASATARQPSRSTTPTRSVSACQRAYDRLRSWSASFAASRVRLAPKDDLVGAVAYLMLSRHAKMISLPVKAGIGLDEFSSPAVRQDYQLIVAQSIEIHEVVGRTLMANTPYEHRPDVPPYLADRGWITPLLHVALKCRTYSLRRQAVRLIESTSTREGAWDSTHAALIARRVIEIETGGSFDDEDSSCKDLYDDPDLAEATGPIRPESSIKITDLILPDGCDEKIGFCYTCAGPNLDTEIIVTEYDSATMKWTQRISTDLGNWKEATAC